MAVQPGDKVWIVLEGPDMTYYGDATIYGVFTDEEKARAGAVREGVEPSTFNNVTIEEYEVE